MLKIKWIGQSGYILSDEKTTICIDPYLSDVVNRVANRPRMVALPVKPNKLYADAVICTHNHLDHLDIDAIPQMDTENICFFAPSDCENTLHNLGVKKYISFDEGKKQQIGDFTITAVFAYHTVPAVGIFVEHNGITLYFSGDTYYHKKLENMKCDYMFVCINGKLGNMNANDAIKLTNTINPTVAIPNHYGMFESNTQDPKKFDVTQRFIMEFDKEYEVTDQCLI